MGSNQAAWLVAEKVNPLEIKPADLYSPAENEIFVKNGAIAINPADWMLQDSPFFPLKYPNILGHDVAGTVVGVGSSVTRFRKGDRVLGHAVGMATQKPRDGGLQEYTILLSNMASKIPDSLPFENAVVLPLTISTAAAALFQKGLLTLQHPSLNPKPTGQTVLVWGGASSVGCNAIQLAVAAGYEVVTTASPKNLEYLKKLGASRVFDYNSKTVTENLIAAFKEKTMAGVVDCINSNGAIESCIAVAVAGQGKKFIATVLFPPEKVPEGVDVKWIAAYSIKVCCVLLF